MTRNRSAQTIFNIAARRLYKQGKRAVNINGDCMYRASDGCKCAIGANIPDRFYFPRMEGLSITALKRDFPEVAPYIYGDAKGFLGYLQLVHDDPGNWSDEPFPRKALAALARGYNLKTNVLDALPVKLP